MEYKYRGLPCNLTAKPWCICGTDLLRKGGGVLEWCYNKADAEAVLKIMKNYPKQFSNLRIEGWIDYEDKKPLRSMTEDRAAPQPKLTKREQELYDKMTEEEFKALVLQSVRLQLKGRPMCNNQVKYIAKAKGFNECVSSIVSDSNDYYIPSFHK